MADISFNTQVLARVLDAPLSYDEQNKSFSTATAAYLKGATQTAFALGYSRGWFDGADQNATAANSTPERNYLYTPWI